MTMKGVTDLILPSSRGGRVWFLALVLVVVVALGAMAAGVVLQQRNAAQGTIVVTASGRHATTLGATGVALHGASGWTTLGQTERSPIATAPTPTELLQGSVPAGSYDTISVGRHQFRVSLVVQQGLVSPVLFQVLGGQPFTVYAGQDQVNLGEQELSGKLTAVPTFDLPTASGTPFTNASIAGKTVILTAFQTQCQEACPLYTGLFLQLSKHLPKDVVLAEVSIDPWDDSVSALQAYAKRSDVTWPLVTGSVPQMTAFWNAFGFAPTTGDDHASVLMVIDEHGYVRDTYQGIPDVDGLPSDLHSQLDGQGRYDLGHGNGWGQAQVLTSVDNVQQLVDQAPAGGQPAKNFSGAALHGGTSRSLAEYRGRPVVINFFASYCTPCRAELPMLQEATKEAGVPLLLIDERDDNGPALALLKQTGVRAPAVADPSGSIGNLYGVNNLPDTYYVFKNGRLEGSTLGELTQTELQLNLQAMRQGQS